MTRKIFLTLVVLLIVASATAGYFYWRWNELKNNPTSLAEKEKAALVEAVGKLILLPLDEQPTIATVTDPAKLSDQVFFANAKVGDKVLVYSLAKKAILYDPNANKIIEVGPVNITNESSQSISGSITE